MSAGSILATSLLLVTWFHMYCREVRRSQILFESQTGERRELLRCAYPHAVLNLPDMATKLNVHQSMSTYPQKINCMYTCSLHIHTHTYMYTYTHTHTHTYTHTYTHTHTHTHTRTCIYTYIYYIRHSCIDRMHVWMVCVNGLHKCACTHECYTFAYC